MTKNIKYDHSSKIYYKILNALFSSHLGFIGATYIIFFYQQGFSKLQTNMLSGLFTIAVIITEIPSGAYSDIFGKRKTLLISGFLLTLSMIFFYIGHYIQIFMFAQLLWGVSFAFESGALDAWIVNKIDTKSNALDKLFASSHTITSITMAIGGLIGAVIATYNMEFIWLISTITSGCYLILVNFTIFDSKGDITSNVTIKNNLKSIINVIKESFLICINNKLVLLLLLFNMLISFTFSPIFIYWAPYLKSLINKEIWILGVIWVIIKVFNACGNYFSGKLSSKFSRVSTLTVLVISFSLVLLAAAVSNNFYTVLSLFLFFEILLGVLQPIQKSYINDYITDDMRSTILSFDSLTSKFSSLISLIIFGFIGDLFSISLTWFISGGIILIGLIIVTYIRLIEQKYTMS